MCKTTISLFTAARARRCIAAATSALFLLANAGTSFAQGWDSRPQSGASPAGMAATLRLNVPFGGEAETARAPAVSFSLTTEWRGEGRWPHQARIGYAPGLDAGFALDGRPILRLGQTDLLDGGFTRLAAAAQEEGTNKWVWWALGGVVVIAVVAWAIAENNKDEICDDSDYFC